MDHFTQFLQDRWIIIAAAIVVLFIVVKLVKTVVKWVIVIAIIAGLYIYGASYKDKLLGMKDQVVGTLVQQAEQETINAVVGEAKDAKYAVNADGTYTVSTKNLELKGQTGSNEAKLSYKGHSTTIKLDDTIKKFIEQAKANSK